MWPWKRAFCSKKPIRRLRSGPPRFVNFFLHHCQYQSQSACLNPTFGEPISTSEGFSSSFLVGKQLFFPWLQDLQAGPPVQLLNIFISLRRKHRMSNVKSKRCKHRQWNKVLLDELQILSFASRIHCFRAFGADEFSNSKHFSSRCAGEASFWFFLQKFTV